MSQSVRIIKLFDAIVNKNVYYYIFQKIEKKEENIKNMYLSEQ